MYSVISISSLIILYVGLVSGDVDCGIKGQDSLLWRIVGGHNAGPHEWPWQVHLLIKRDNGNFLCGGSIISDQWVLSAGHCLDQSKGVARLRLGEYNLQKGDNNELDIGVEKVIFVTFLFFHSM